MKTIIRFVLFASIMLAGLSCTKLSLDKETSQFVGVWSVSSDNPEAKLSYWVFYDDGTAKNVNAYNSVSAPLSEMKVSGTGKWTYDKKTNILATTLNLFQVQTTMVGENVWTAIGTDGRYHYTGTLLDESDLMRIHILLMGTKWEGNKLGSFSIGAPLSARLGKFGTSYGTALACSTPAKIQETENINWTHLRITKYKDSDDELHYSLLTQKVGSGMGNNRYFEGNDVAVNEFKLSNPLSPSSCRLAFNFTITVEKSDYFVKKREYGDTFKLEPSE